LPSAPSFPSSPARPLGPSQDEKIKAVARSTENDRNKFFISSWFFRIQSSVKIALCMKKKTFGI
jgi:hypothetical protein